MDSEKLARVLCFCNATLPTAPRVLGYQTLGSLRDRRLSLSTASRWSGVEEIQFKYAKCFLTRSSILAHRAVRQDVSLRHRIKTLCAYMLTHNVLGRVPWASNFISVSTQAMGDADFFRVCEGRISHADGQGLHTRR